MSSDVPSTASSALFAPKLVTVLREGYGPAAFRADAMAGLTVAIVALPLSMAIAIASGTTPERGLFTAIVGGFLISALGGSRFQVGGPAGAFIVLVAACVARHGIEGTLLATLMAGVFLIAAGFLKLGTFIKFIPYPVTVGFTAGIAVIILASQLKDLFGLTLAGREPGEFAAKIEALAQAWGSVNASAVALALLTIGTIVGLKHVRPHWPGMLLAVVAASLATFALGLPRSPPSPWGSRSRRSAAASAAFPRCCRRPACLKSLSQRSRPCCRMPSPSPCSAPSSRCSRRSWPMA
jgi:SulP family sulfate permease